MEAAMATRARREMTVEEFNAWADARKDVAEVLDICSEEGGPSVSLVPAIGFDRKKVDLVLSF